MTKMVSIVQLSKVATVDILHAISCYLHFKDTELQATEIKNTFQGQKYENQDSRQIFLTRVWSLHHHNPFINRQLLHEMVENTEQRGGGHMCACELINHVILFLPGKFHYTNIR